MRSTSRVRGAERLCTAAVLLGLLGGVACQPAAPASPTAAPSKPTEAATPTTAASAASPATLAAPVSSPSPSASPSPAAARGVTFEASETSGSATGPSGPPPYITLGGMQGLVPNDGGWVTVDLTPGEYAALCVIPDPTSGKRHIELGMITPFSVR